MVFLRQQRKQQKHLLWMLTWRNTYSWEDPAWPGNGPCQNCKRTIHRQKLSLLIGTEMKRKVCSFLRKQTASSQTFKDVNEFSLLSTFLVSFLWRCWLVLFFFSFNTLLLLTCEKLTQKWSLMLNNMHAPCASISKAFMMLTLLEGPFSPGKFHRSYSGRNQCSANAH